MFKGKSRKLLGVITLVIMLLSVLPMQVMAADFGSTITVQPTAQVQNQTGSAKNNSTINPFWYMQAYGSSNNAQNESIGNNDGAIYAVKDPVQEALESVTNDYLQPAANGSSVSKSTFLGDPGTTNVTGTVIDPVTSQTVQTVTRLEVRYWDSTGSYWKRYYTETITDGSFELYLAQGSYAILANPDMSSSYGQSQAVEITVDGTGNASPSNFSLTLANQNIISGIVIDKSGIPVANAQVVMSYSGRPPQNANDGFTKTRIFETDQFGNYKIGSLSDGYYIFRADAGDSGKSYKMEVLVSGGIATISDGQLQSDGLDQLTIHPFNIRGQVTKPDYSSGTPVKWVEILPTRGNLGYSTYIDSHGYYREVILPGEYTVQALAADNSGYTNSLRYWINVDEYFCQDLNLTTAKISGTVKDVGGTPANGARVEIRSAQGGPTLDYTYADANGQFSLGGIDDNPDYRIIVYYNNKEFTTNTFSVPFNGPLNIQIKDPNVSGNVLDPQGNMSQTAEIIISKANGDYFASYYGTNTDENGNFAVYLDPGEYYITASPKGISGYARSMSQKITVTESETVTIPPIKLTTPIITGYVNLDGISVPNAEVNIDFQGPDTENGFVDHVRTRTMDDGKFLLGGFNPGKYTLSIDSEQGNKKVNLEVIGTRTVNLNLNPVNVNGTVYMPNGQPASGVPVYFDITDGTSAVGDLAPVNHVRVITDQEGNYRYGLEQNCDYILQARPVPQDSRYSSFTNSQRIWFSTYGSGCSFDLTLTTPMVKGVVSDQNNNPVPHAWVEIKMPWAGPYDTNADAVETDETGHYQLSAVDPFQQDMYTIQAYSDGLNSPRYNVKLDPNAVITQDLVIQPPNVKGQVFDTDGVTPYQGEAWVDFFSIDNNGNNYYCDYVRPDGSFEFNLPQGNYYAKVYAETAGNQNKRTSPKLLTVGSSISTLSFTLRDVVANPQVKVTVKDTNGNSLPVEIEAIPVDTALHCMFYDWPFFDNGKTYFGGLTDTDYNFFIKYPFGYRKIPVKVVDGVATPNEISLSVDNTTNINGTVTEADGQTPLPAYYLGIQPKELDYEVAAGEDNGSYPYEGPFDYVQSANGQFNIYLDDGEYSLIAARQTDPISKASQGKSTITVQGGQIVAGTASIKIPPMVPQFVESQPLAPAHMEQPFHYELDFIGGRPWYSLNIKNRPDWLNISWNDWLGKIRFDGIPSDEDVGINSFTINLQDSNGILASKKISVMVEGPSPYPVFIENIDLMEAKAGKLFVDQLVAKNGTTPYTWKATGLPTWLTLDVNTGVLSGTPPTTSVGPNYFQVSVTDSTNQTVSQGYDLNVCPTMLYAVPKISVGEDPASGNTGVYIGIEKFMDESYAELPNAKIAGYVMTLNYPLGAMKLADPIAIQGDTPASMFTFNNDNPGTLTVSNALPTGTLDYQKLFFIPMTVNSPADVRSDLDIQFDDVEIIPDGNSIDLVPVQMARILPGMPVPMLMPILMMPVAFQRGKILNSNQIDPMNLPRVTDAIAGLQYLAGLRNAGLAPGQVNVVNMASIVPSDTGAGRPSVTGIVSLLQYLAKLRDNNFSVIAAPSAGGGGAAD